jgi:AraC-like DNA-binding protein
MNKKATDYGNVIYSPSVVHTGREHVELCFLQNNINVKITCSILEQGFTDRHEAMHFIHPAPPFSRLFIFTQGGADIIIPNGKIRLKPGKIYLIPPNQPFDVTYEISKLIFFHLHIFDAAGQSLFMNTKGIPAINDPVLFERFRQGFENTDKIQTFSAIMDSIRLLLNDRLNVIAEKAEKSRHFSMLFDYLPNRPIAKVTIEELAELYSISPDALSKRFRRTMGISLKHYLLERQLNQARELLLHSEMTISKISELLGHSNSQYFHRFFKNNCLCTPTEYRQKHYRDLMSRYIQRA